MTGAAAAARPSLSLSTNNTMTDTNNTLPARVADMLANAGVYIAGDTKQPDVTSVLISRDGKVFSTTVGDELGPDGFSETLTLQGPYKASARKAIAAEAIRAAFPAGKQRDAAMLMHEELEQLRSKVARYYVSYLRYSFIELLADRNPNGGIVAFLQWIAANASNAYQLNMAIDRFMKAAAEPKKQ